MNDNKKTFKKHKMKSWILPFLSAVLLPNICRAAGSARPLIIENPLGVDKNIYTFVYSILDFVVKVGTVVVIFMVIYSGFLFVKAQGDSSGISDAKNTFYWTVIGGVVLIGARALARVVCNTAASLASGITCPGL